MDWAESRRGTSWPREMSAPPCTPRAATPGSPEASGAKPQGTPSGGAPAESPVPVIASDTNPVELLVQFWRDFQGTDYYKLASMKNPREALPPVSAVLLGLLLLHLYSFVELLLLFLCLAVVLTGVLDTVSKAYGHPEQIPRAHEIVQLALRRTTVRDAFTSMADWVHSNVQGAQHVLSWTVPLDSVRGAAASWLLYRFSFLVAPVYGLVCIVMLVTLCAAHFHLLGGNTRELEDSLAAKAKAPVQQALGQVRNVVSQVQTVVRAQSNIALGGALVATAFLIYFLRTYIPILTVVSLLAWAVMGHWALAVVQPATPKTHKD